EGIRAIAERVHGNTARLANALKAAGLKLTGEAFFDTLTVELDAAAASKLLAAARAKRINLRAVSATQVGGALDETVTKADGDELIELFGARQSDGPTAGLSGFRRATPYLTHPVFHKHRSETEMLRYIRKLEGRDLALNAAMIPLGSCTMKLNATAEMVPV